MITNVQVGDVLLVTTAGQWSTLATVTEVTRSIVTAPPYRFERRSGREITNQRFSTRQAVIATEADIEEVKTNEAKHKCISDIRKLVDEHQTVFHLTLKELSRALKILSRTNPILTEGYAPKC